VVDLYETKEHRKTWEATLGKRRGKREYAHGWGPITEGFISIVGGLGQIDTQTRNQRP